MRAQNGHGTGTADPGATYILPLKRTSSGGLGDLPQYLGRVAEWAEVLVVDGSAPEVFAAHSRELPPGVAHLAPVHRCLNGKVAGVLTGLERARTELCVIADDDVRYTETPFRRVLALLADADVVRPQNYFLPLPWHARWDTARSLLNRALGADYPGTLGVRRSVLLRAGGYCGDVLFENLEMIRTVRAAGGGTCGRRRYSWPGSRAVPGIFGPSACGRPMTTSRSRFGWRVNWRCCPCWFSGHGASICFLPLRLQSPYVSLKQAGGETAERRSSPHHRRCGLRCGCWNGRWRSGLPCGSASPGASRTRESGSGKRGTPCGA